MILPSKHLPADKSLLASGGVLLRHVIRPTTVSSLWDRVKEIPEISSFNRFVLALDLLYLVGAVTMEDGLIRRAKA
mgnify:CR=1 FL=1